MKNENNFNSQFNNDVQNGQPIQNNIEPNKKSNKNIIGILLIMLIAILVAVIIFIIINRGNKIAADETNDNNVMSDEINDNNTILDETNDNIENVILIEKNSCLGNETEVISYIENNKVKVKYNFVENKTNGIIDLEVQNPKKLYVLHDLSCDMGDLIILTNDNYLYKSSFTMLASTNKMGEIIKISDKKIKEIDNTSLINQLKVTYEDGSSEVLSLVKGM